MLKKTLSFLLVSAIISTGLGANTTPSPSAEALSPTEESPSLSPLQAEEDKSPDYGLAPESPAPREVGAASQSAAQAAKTKKWQNIGIACAAIAVAGLAIFLASTNGGSDAKHCH